MKFSDNRKFGILIVLCLALFLVAGALSYRASSALLSAVGPNGSSAAPIAGLMRNVAVALAGCGLAAMLMALISVAFVRRETHRLLRTEERLDRLRQTAEQSADLITIVNRKGRIEYVNRAVEETTGYTRQELAGKRSTPWLPWYDDENILREIRKHALSGRPFQAVTTARRKNGERLFLRELVTPLRDRTGNIKRMVSTAQDITGQKLLQDRIDYLDRFDLLTGIPNRNHVAERLDQEIGAAKLENRSFAVMILDIDRFKYINDLFGPGVGDEVLKEVVGRLRAAVSERDIVARLGSDEFAVVHFYDAQFVDTASVAEQLRNAALQSIVIGEQDIVVTVTIGVSAYPRDGSDAHTLLKNADMALVRAKAEGRNTVRFFDANADRRIPEVYFLEKRLFSALEKDEYVVTYQPYCDLSTKKVAGAEALIKWRNGDLGVVSPTTFIPALEETGMIIDVGEWVLKTACRQIRDWKGRNRMFSVSVNLSLIQFRHKYLVGMVADTIREFSLDPRHLTLEITESIFIHDMDFAVDTLKKLKDVGVSISVDDFGTGFSSLSYLKKLPVDTVKIDISFVRDVARDPDAASIISAITTMARSLNLKTIAEGVETEEQRNILHLLRCDMGQGFYFSRPVPGAEFEKFLG